MRPLADIQLAVVSRESISLIRTFQNAEVFPLVAVVSIDRSFVVARGEDVAVVDGQRLDTLSVGRATRRPLGSAFVAKEPRRSVQRPGIQTAAINHQAADR